MLNWTCKQACHISKTTTGFVIGMFDSRVVEDETVELEDLVENRDVGDLLDVEADVAVQRRDPLKLARLKPASVAHVGSPDDVQLA